MPYSVDDIYTSGRKPINLGPGWYEVTIGRVGERKEKTTQVRGTSPEDAMAKWNEEYAAAVANIRAPKGYQALSAQRIR